MDEDAFYRLVGTISGVVAAAIAFFGGWIYCASTYGFLFGFGLGWLPSALLAGICYLVMRYLWPLTAIGVVYVVYKVMQA
jgi:hypothetical protein